jgi:hypothetical protein
MTVIVHIQGLQVHQGITDELQQQQQQQQQKQQQRATAELTGRQHKGVGRWWEQGQYQWQL